MSSSLAAFVEAKARWKVWLDEDAHSINGQLSHLLWNDAVFRSFNEARKWAAESEPSSAVAPILAQFLDQGYVSAQVIGISKLIEWSNPKAPKKGVISLRRLVDDLLENHALLTRENYLAAEGLVYDYKPSRSEALRKTFEKPRGVSFDWIDLDADGGWGRSEMLHAQFDRYAQVLEANRKPSDVVDRSVLERLDNALNSEIFRPIRTLRHKEIAHAADELSRKEVEESQKGPTLSDVDLALRTLLGVRQVIQAGILYDSWRAGAVPVPQHNQFQYLDLPFVHEGGIEKLQEFWHLHGEVRDAWLSEAYQELAPPKLE